MKKLFLTLFLSLCAVGATFAGNYKMNDASIDAAFAASEDVTMNVTESALLADAAALADGETTKMGFLLRNYFCGSIALHRSYMGTGGAALWWKYLCIPVAGSIASMVDFWGVIIKGDERLEMYRDNPNFFAWKK